GVHVFMSTFGRLPSSIDSVTAGVARALDRLFGLAQAREQEQAQRAAIEAQVAAVSSNVGSLLSQSVGGGTSNRARSIRASFDATTAEMSDYERITSKHNPDANIPRLQQIANILSGLGAQFADLLGVTLPEYQLWVRNNI